VTAATSKSMLLTPAAIEAIPPVPLGVMGGVTHRVLWRSDTSMAGVLTVAAGSRLGTHAHRVNHHHMWVLDGHAVVLGESIGPGTYVHIPSGVDHDIDASGTEGCAVFYLYLRPSD
jgi:mannose-6-phosphate isomerase-like protein (cupin superfamily)